MHLVCLKVAIFNNADPSCLLNGCCILSEKYQVAVDCAELGLNISILPCVCAHSGSVLQCQTSCGEAEAERMHTQTYILLLKIQVYLTLSRLHNKLEDTLLLDGLIYTRSIL